MHSISLDGKWNVLSQPLASSGDNGLKKARRTRKGWIPSRVPGEIHLDLMNAGRMDEPLKSLNASGCRWPETRSWWYRTSFQVTEAFLAEERQDLVFDGIDYFGQVFVNGVLAGESENAFIPTVIDVRGKLKAGRNDLLVRVTAGTECSPEPADERLGKEVEDVWQNKTSWNGVRWLRKPQFTYGWDWVDALPNIGIWRSVHLEGRSGVVFHDLRVDTTIVDTEVYVDIEAVIENLHPWSSRPCRLELCFQSPDGKTSTVDVEINAQVGRQPVYLQIEMADPQLWWPNGMGRQPLYFLVADIVVDDDISDRRQFHFGLRTIEINQEPLPEGSRFAICVNGEDVFCKGGNWIPADAILARVTRKKYDALVDAAADAKINMLRIWGGGIYENDAFYDACNRAGILVWHDFMFACKPYPDADDRFRAKVKHEAETAVRRLRHHPCIALWSGNNENVWGFCNWWNDDKAKAGDPLKLELGGSLVYNEVLPEVCRLLDPRRPYWPGSPCGGAEPNSETVGDCHWWHLATMNPEIERRIDHEIYDECRSRFNSEYGVIGPVNLSSFRKFLNKDELDVDSKAFQAHTNWFEKGTTPAAIRRHYADPDALALKDYIIYGQMFQATMYGRSIESMRFRKNDPKDDCQGALIWMYTDCWGETGWTLIDYYLSRKPSYYWFKRACAPVRAIVRRRRRRLITRIVNDTLEPVNATLYRGWMRLDGIEHDVAGSEITLPANGTLEFPAERLPSRKQRDPHEWFYAAWLEIDGRTTDASTWFGAPFRELALPKPSFEIHTKGDDVTLMSNVYCHGVHANDNGRGTLTDNYFDLLPGKPHRLQRLSGKAADKLRFKAVEPNR